jgi:hypothetical protein
MAVTAEAMTNARAPIAIDEDVRQEYWSDVPGASERVHEGVIHA